MASSKTNNAWGEKGRSATTTIYAQVHADPQIPRPNPTEPLWQTPAHPIVSNARSQKLPQAVDYLIIGSGIAGCGAAQELLSNPASKGRTVTILEARTVCSGATGRNGGQITKLPPGTYNSYVRLFGVAEANRIFQFTLKGLEAMEALADAQGPEIKAYTKFTNLEKFFAYYTKETWEQAVKDVELFERENPDQRGIYRPVSAKEAQEVYDANDAYGGFLAPAAVGSAYRLVTSTFAALLDKYKGRFTIESETPATAVNYEPQTNSKHPYRVQTRRGDVRATHIIYCSNAHTSHLTPGLIGKMYPRRGTMSVQRPGNSFPKMAERNSWSMFWGPGVDTKAGAIDGGHYYGFQEKETGDIWIGGDKDAVDGFISADDTVVDAQSDANLRQLLPNVFTDKILKGDKEVRRVWSGIMAYTGDRLPFIGSLPSSVTGRQGSSEWMAGAWNVWGMCNALLGGATLAKMVLGEPTPAYLPKSYLISEKRLSGKKFESNEVVKDFFVRTGIPVPKEVEERISSKL